MTVEQLAKLYEEQEQLLSAKIEALKPLMNVYSGNDLRLLRKRIKTYTTMKEECCKISSMLSEYKELQENG